MELFDDYIRGLNKKFIEGSFCLKSSQALRKGP